jgi:hypothetical protein
MRKSFPGGRLAIRLLFAETDVIAIGEHVADSTPIGLGIAISVLDDPLINGACLAGIRSAGARDLRRRLLDDAVGRKKPSRPRIVLQLSGSGLRRAFTGAEKFTAQSLVATRLVTVRIGSTPGGNSATIIPIASVLFPTVLAAPPSQWKVLASVL